MERIDACLKYFAITKDELLSLKPGDKKKQMLTDLLRTETTMTYDWIVREIGMGSTSSVYKATCAVKQYSGKGREEYEKLKKVSRSLH